jgi:hypothetical protein
MTTPDFYGPNLKVERAKHHIDSLETIFEQFISRNIKRLRPKRDNQFLMRGAATSRLFPEHTPTVLGDALHNLKSPLDHAYCIMVKENGRTVTRYTLFPFGKCRKSLEGSINGQKLEGLTPSDAIIDVILNEIQPYEAGSLGSTACTFWTSLTSITFLSPQPQIWSFGNGLNCSTNSGRKQVTAFLA